MDNVIQIKDLLPGMVIVKITGQNGPVKIRKSGLVTSHEMVSGLAEMGVQEVEIDPAQTVEIERPVAQKSLTQQLLQSPKRSDHGLDSALSEQFNRSLFLPSVAQIPSLWQYYAKRIISAALVLVCGLVLGWLGATYHQWLPSNDSTAVIKASTEASPPSAQISKQDDVASPQVMQTADKTKAPERQVDSNPLPQVDNSADESQSKKPVAKQPVVIEPKVSQTPAQTAQPQAPQISSDLLKRFENAINDLDSMPKTGFEPRINSASDVPRIDQLPDWVLTKLPGMAFTAHMYASKPQDRWVRVNDVRMVEGDMIDAKVKIQSIESQHVILNYDGQVFSMSALTDW
ncbi:MAG: general secretion pathway protein B [Paraglaciecola sp.]|jgi:general secretion pathway protein B